MMDVLPLPVLLGALMAVGFCGRCKSRRRRPSFWPAILIGLVIGVCAFVLFWRENAQLPLETLWVIALFGFGLFALASFIPAAIVVAVYRFQMGD